MTIYYVGPGGNDGSAGTSWGARKLTLNGAEDIPVAAGDVVYVGPGTYRETLTVDVSGSAGNQIVYIGDVTGENTDNIGGVVRVTGSDNDQSATRDQCVAGSNDNYRTFRGFAFDTTVTVCIEGSSCSNWIIEDCSVMYGRLYCIDIVSDTQIDWIIRRCLIGLVDGGGIRFRASSIQTNVGHLIENCMFLGCHDGVKIERIGGCVVRNCTFMGNDDGVDVSITAGTGAGEFTTVENCIIIAHPSAGVEGAVSGDIVEDYNTFYSNDSDRINTATGGNSKAYPPIFVMPLLLEGYRFLWMLGELSHWSQVARIAGNSEPSGDLHGFARPATASKNSWGALQFVDAEREIGTVQAGSVGRVLHDAGLKFVRRVPTSAVSTAISIYTRRETNYAGSVPRMIIRQPGVAERTTDMTVAVDNWEQLSDTFTPAATPPYVDVFVESRNTATSGSYDVFYDTLEVV